MELVKRLFLSTFWAFALAIIGIVLSIVVAQKSAQWIENNELTRFNAATEHIKLLIHKTLDADMQLLNSTALFFNSSQEVTRDEWQKFISGHHLKNFYGIQAIGYAPFVKGSKRLEHEAWVQNEGFPSYAIEPKGVKDALPVTYVEPFNERNQKAFGLDMYAEPMRANSANHAFKTGSITLSPKLKLRLEEKEDSRAGFILFVPLYEKSLPLTTEQERFEAKKGIAYAVMSAKYFFDGFSSSRYILADFEVFDGQIPTEEHKLYDSNPTLSDVRLEDYSVLNLYGNTWTIRFKSNEALDIGLSRYFPLLELVFGSLFSLLVGSWLYAVQRSSATASRLVEEKTQQLSYSEAQIRSVFQAMHDGILVQNNEGIFTDCNASAERILGLSADEIIGGDLHDVRWQAISEEGVMLEVHERPSYKALHTKKPQYNVVMGIKRSVDGTTVWVLSNVEPILSQDQQSVTSVVITLSDITEYRQSKQQLQSYIEIIDAYVIISSTDCEGIITEVSEAFCKISGHTKEELIGKNHSIVRHPDMPSLIYQQMWEQLKCGKSWHGEVLNRRKDGSSYWVETIIAPRFDELGAMIGYTAIRQDITDKKRVEEISITDRLTGLYNRLKLDELFAFHLSMARRHQSDFSIILVDIDHFKNVNDTFGHQVGDSLLQEIASCLQSRIRLEDAVGRWGGEEFLLLLPSSNLVSAVHLAEKLRHCVEHIPFTTVGKATASFGVTSFEPNDDDKSMLKRADEALYLAKNNGRNRVESLSSHS